MTHADGPDGLCVATGQPVEVLRTYSLDAVSPLIDRAHALAMQGRYVVGGLSYEAAPAFDASLHVCADPAFPVLEFHVFDAAQVSVWPMSILQAMDQGAFFHPWQDVQTSASYADNFEQVRHAIEAGEFYQINLTTRLKARREQLDSWALFQHLYLAQTALQSLFLRGGEFDVLSLSPELFFQWDGVELKTAPMKGTRRPQPGGFDVLSDSEKDRAENVMIVDLLRNDMAKVCMPRSVQVRSLFDVMYLPTVDQMTSSICGTTNPGCTLRDIFAALFPCGSVTGAPKAQAMLRIAQWEKLPRKFYCGALGVLSPGGAAHFNVPIRTVIASGDEFEYGVGSGMTWYSTQVDEKKEWWQKTTFLRQATCDFDLLETLRLEQGQWINLDDHIVRMAQAANHFSYVFDSAAAFNQLEKLAHQHAQGVYRARCLLQADGTLNVELHSFQLSSAPVQLRLAKAPMNARPEFILHKTTHRPEYDRFLDQAQGAFDVVLFSEAGYLTETCRCNLIVKIQGELFTPHICSSTNTYLLPGVLRAQLLRENTIRPASLSVQDLQRAEQVWVINSLRGWVPVQTVLGAEGELLFSDTINKK